MSAYVAENRQQFLASVNAHLRRDPRAVVVVRIDLDRFSRIRQVFGVEVAAAVHDAIVARIAELVDTPDSMLALAEDGFAAVVRTSDLQGDALAVLGKRFVDAVSAPISLAGHPEIAVGSSAGVAAAAQFGRADAAQVLAGAEHAVQQAAELGSRRIIVYHVAPSDDPTRLPELYADMLGALSRGEFVAYLQGVVELPSRRVIGAETLVRWAHPIHGVLSPGDFLGEAERSGLIRDIDAAVWRQSWSTCAAAPVDRAFTVAVNLSPADLDFPGLLDNVESAIRDAGIDPRRLVFEVTETALSVDWARSKQRLASLRSIGCRIAVDDFGSGHMFLERLATGLFDVLKIDRSLVATAASDARSVNLLAGVVSLAQSLGLRTLAEGVETEAQAQLVTEVGCDKAQGFYFGRPVPCIEFVNGYNQR